jgi:hypothetical protein
MAEFTVIDRTISKDGKLESITFDPEESYFSFTKIASDLADTARTIIEEGYKEPYDLQVDLTIAVLFYHPATETETTQLLGSSNANISSLADIQPTFHQVLGPSLDSAFNFLELEPMTAFAGIDWVKLNITNLA